MRFLCLFLLLMPALAAAPTYSREVAPILFRHCAGCHRPGDVAPMSLLDYKTARPWAKSIRDAVVSRRMPPWFADPAHGRFSNDARLSDADIATIRQWVEAGAPEGDRAQLPPKPKFVEGWHLGEPDMVIDIGQDFQVKPGIDDYVHFIVPARLTQGRWIRAVEFRPGNRKVVHHGHVNLVRGRDEAGSTTIESMTPLTKYLEREGSLTRVRADAPVLDDACVANAPDLPYLRGYQEGAFASFLPGRPPDVFAEGSAKWLPAGAQMEFVIHYARITGPPQTDRTSIGLYFAKDPQKILYRMDLRNFFFRIPPMAPAHTVRRCYDFEKDKLLLSITPHMHFRGKDVRYELIRPSGARETILAVPGYHFDWQLVYRFADPIRIEKGSRLEVTAHFDNSPNNKANPDPSVPIRWGDKSEEEMMTSWIEYFEVDPVNKPTAAGPASN